MEKLGRFCQRGVCQERAVERDVTGGEWCAQHANDDVTRAMVARIQAAEAERRAANEVNTQRS